MTRRCLAVAILLAVGLVLAVGACSDDGPSVVVERSSTTAGASTTDAPTTEVVVGDGDGDGSGALSAPRRDLDAATLAVLGGADTVTIRSSDLGDDLYHVVVPDGSSAAPSAVVDDHGLVQVQVGGDGGSGIKALEIDVAADVAWGIRLEGGATEETVDMGAGGLATLDLLAGATRIEVTAPAPQGTTTITMSGGATDLVVHAPGAAPVQVTAGGGAGSVTIDGERHDGIGGGTAFTPDGWDTATDRIDVQCTAGVSNVVVDRTN